MKGKLRELVLPGRFYRRGVHRVEDALNEGEAQWQEILPTAEVDVLICRRLIDFAAGGALLPGSKVETCGGCSFLIVVSPSSPADVERRCFQCEGLTPAGEAPPRRWS